MTRLIASLSIRHRAKGIGQKVRAQEALCSLLYALCFFLWMLNSSIIRNPLRPLIDNLDKLPFPDREICDYQKLSHGSARFIFSRGCPFDCTYCCNHAVRGLYSGLGKYVRQRSVGNALEEINSVLTRYKVSTLVFDDDTFTLNKEWVLEFCSEYKRRFALPFACNIRVGTCDEEILQSLKEAGCEKVHAGIESGNSYIRNEVLKRNMSDEGIKQTFDMVSRVGLSFVTGNMVGLPYEDPEKFQDTIRLNNEIKPDSSAIQVFYPYPGTELGDLCRENNQIREDVSEDFIERDDSILNLPNFKREDILKCKKKFEIEVVKPAIKRKSILQRIIISLFGYSGYSKLRDFRKRLRRKRLKFRHFLNFLKN